MPTPNPWKSYRQITTMTASPGQIVLMLYEGALRSLELSLPGFTCPDPGQANMTIHNNLQRALEIIQQLNGALNLEVGGEFALTMRRLYDYFVRRIRQSNIRKESSGVEEVIRHMTVLRDAWATMLQNPSPVPGPVANAPAAYASI